MQFSLKDLRGFPSQKCNEARCLKNTKKSHFTTKVHKNAKNRQFGGHIVLSNKSILIGQKLRKIPKLKISIETFWVIFKQCAKQREEEKTIV